MELKPRTLAIAIACVANETTFTLEFLSRIGEEEYSLELAENGFVIKFRRFHVGLFVKDGVFFFQSREQITERAEPAHVQRAAKNVYDQVMTILAREKEAREEETDVER